MFLDTNVYSALAQGVPAAVDAVNLAHGIVIPLPVIAELHYGFLKGSQPERNEQQLERFLAQPQVSVAVAGIQTTEHYARLQLICQRQGKALSQNDLWIAAMAREADVRLVTFDRDFLVFQDLLGDKLVVLE